MRSHVVTGACPALAVLLVWPFLAGCGSVGPSDTETLRRATADIQGGTTDLTDDFVVAVIQRTGSAVALCSGVLLAPNLVATARHCVSDLPSDQIDCASSRFTDTLSPADVLVTPVGTLPAAASQYVGVANNGIFVPTDPAVCGNDIALLVLTRSISVPQYVTPTANPPMTDHQAYGTTYAAIGYGVDTPTDTNGTTAGTRRIRQNIPIACIPNAPGLDCFSSPTASDFLSAREFEGGDGTCEGDSGSGAFDQNSFDAGRLFAFGVLSRGGISDEGGMCQGSVYTRFDAWGPNLLAPAAMQAASLGGYAPPSWVQQAAAGAGVAASSSGGAVACSTNGASCGARDGVDVDGGADSNHGGGCGIAAARPRGTSQPTGASVALAIAGVALGRRRRRVNRSGR